MNDLQDDKPPLFASWRTWYIFVLAFLLLQVILFTIFTNNFA